VQKKQVVTVKYLCVRLCAMETILVGAGIVFTESCHTNQTHLCIIRTNKMPCQPVLQADLKCDVFLCCVSRDVALL
jgi:hypothetical protein